MTKKEKPQRRSLNARIDAELASSENIPLAGVTQESSSSSSSASSTSASSSSGVGGFPTKKATTIMPKEVFVALQRYCTNTDTPKHRALYMFIIDGLHAAGEIADDDYLRFRDMASLLTTTYEKKK